MSARTKEFSSGTWSTHELTCIWGERIVRRRAHRKIKCNCREEARGRVANSGLQRVGGDGGSGGGGFSKGG